MAFYEVVGQSKETPCYGSAETLGIAKKMRDEFLATGRYPLVFIRQYLRDRYGNERYRVLHTLTKRKL